MLISKFVARLSVVGCRISVSTIAVTDFEMNNEDDQQNPCKPITAKLSKSAKISVLPKQIRSIRVPFLSCELKSCELRVLKRYVNFNDFSSY